MWRGEGKERSGVIGVIDDEPLVCDIIKRALEREYKVETFGAARALFQALEAGRYFDAIICDLMMPDLPGRAIYEEIRTRWPGQEERLIFVSGLSEFEAREGPLQGLESPMLEKPFQLSALREIVYQVVGRSPKESSPQIH